MAPGCAKCDARGVVTITHHLLPVEHLPLTVARGAGAGAAVREQARHPKVVVLGICFGGPSALLAAADGVADGVVTWHGSHMSDFLARASEMRCPMRLHFGGEDPFVPTQAVAAVRSAFTGRHDVRIIVHDGATHGYSHRAAPQAYDRQAERAGMDSLRELIGLV